MRRQWTGGQTCDLLCQICFALQLGCLDWWLVTAALHQAAAPVNISCVQVLYQQFLIIKKQYHNAQFKAHEISCGYWMCYVSKYTVVPYIQLQFDTTAYPSYSSTQQTRTDTHRLWYEHAEYSPCQSLLFLAHSATQTLVNKFINTKNQTDQLLLLFSTVWRPTLLTSDHNS